MVDGPCFSQRVGQPSQWTATDADTLYKFEKRVAVCEYDYLTSLDRDRAIRHVQLAARKGGPADMSGVQYPPRSMVRPVVHWACVDVLI